MDVLNYQHHDFSLQLTLESHDIPDFLTDDQSSENQKIWICQDLKIEFPHLNAPQDNLFDVFLLKFMINVLEMVYIETGRKGIPGVLLIIPDPQAEVFGGLEELFTYIQPHLDHHGECMYMYLPTTMSNYDIFVEIAQNLTHCLDQFLWSQQRFHHSIKQYWQERQTFP